jgi:hypothetical protein
MPARVVFTTSSWVLLRVSWQETHSDTMVPRGGSVALDWNQPSLFACASTCKVMRRSAVSALLQELSLAQQVASCGSDGVAVTLRRDRQVVVDPRYQVS